MVKMKIVWKNIVYIVVYFGKGFILREKEVDYLGLEKSVE